MAHHLNNLQSFIVHRLTQYISLCTCLVVCTLFLQITDIRADTIPCKQVGQIEPICGLTRPEDLTLLPDTDMFIFSQMGGFPSANPGSLAALNTNNNQHRVIYPAPLQDTIEPLNTSTRWGDSNCTSELGAKIGPHGIDVSSYRDTTRLLVVNHGGGRESVEFFELSYPSSIKNVDDIKIQWRGCVLAPEDALFNDVASTPEGGFVVSKMMGITGPWWLQMFRAVFGLNTGYVWEWHPDHGGKIVSGSRGSFPNGVAVSADGLYLFVNMYMTDEVVKIRRFDGTRMGVASIAQGDNMTWDQSQGLLIASHVGGFIEQMRCDGEETPCEFAFEIVRLDPQTMRSKVVFAHRGPPMGAATTALDTGDWLYMGSYAGDRMIRVPYGANSRVVR